MKVKFVCDSGANHDSAREEIVDVQDLGYSDSEWNELSDEDKFECVSDWANEKLEIYWKEI